MGREKFTVHIFQMERCSFLLDVIRSRVVAILETEAHSGSLLDCATILRVSPAYCDFVLKMKAKYPKHDMEQLCMEIYDRIWMHDYHKSTAKFQQFDDDLLKEWYKVRAREKQLRAGLIEKDKAIANFKHAYYVNFGVDIDVTEHISREPEEQKQEQEKATEQELDEDGGETVEEFEARLIEEKLICRMFRDGAIDEMTALKYIGDPHLCHGAFLKIVEIHTGGCEAEPNINAWHDTQKKEHQMELIVKMVGGDAITPEVAFEYMNQGNDFHDFDEFLRILDIWTEKEDKQYE